MARALFDLEPVDADSDYELAFRSVAGGKRAFVLVLTDLVDEAAARSLLDAMPVLARRHAVCVASVRDDALDDHPAHAAGAELRDVYALRSRSTCSRRARAPRGACARRARPSSRRAPSGSPAPASARTCGEGAGAL